MAWSVRTGCRCFSPRAGVESLVRLRGRRSMLRFAGSIGASSVAFRGSSPDPATAIQAVAGSGLEAGQIGGIARPRRTIS
jgi:hypothetical protein